MHAKRILVVEDEPAIREMICSYLRDHDFSVTEADDVDSAQRMLCEQTPNLIVLEGTLPLNNGLELARSVRSSREHWMPLLMIASRASDDEKVAALDAGVDDILSKPFSPRELLARINALLRRCEKTRPRSHNGTASLMLDAVRQRVIVGNRIVELTPTDFRLLSFFVQNPDRAHTRADLLKNVWGADVPGELRTVDVQIRRLRGALAPLQINRLIQTVQGIGYRFSARQDRPPDPE